MREPELLDNFLWQVAKRNRIRATRVIASNQVAIFHRHEHIGHHPDGSAYPGLSSSSRAVPLHRKRARGDLSATLGSIVWWLVQRLTRRSGRCGIRFDPVFRVRCLHLAIGQFGRTAPRSRQPRQRDHEPEQGATVEPCQDTVIPQIPRRAQRTCGGQILRRPPAAERQTRL